MGHQARASPLLLWRPRLRHVLRTLYPSFSVRRAFFRPLSLLSVSFVLTLIAVGVYLVVPVTLLPQYSTRPTATVLRLTVFTWCVVCTLVSYLLTAIAAPGKVPDAWRPREWVTVSADGGAGARASANSHAADGNHSNSSGGGDVMTHTQRIAVAPGAVFAAGTAMVRADGALRFCAFCNVFKPDRAHHCSSCQECVLLMDHHCPFTGNGCIGFLNRKFFVLFLYYATLSCTLVATLTPSAIMRRLQALDERPSAPALVSVIVQMMGYMMCALHALVLAPFSLFHTYLVLKNRTTIEKEELTPRAHLDALRRCDGGWLRNWKGTFGAAPLLWFVPVSYGRVGDGLSWARNDDAV